MAISSPRNMNKKVPSVLADLIERSKWPDVMDRLSTCPEEASLVFNTGFCSIYPLHEACKSQPPSEVVAALLQAFDGASRVKGQWGYLPLHLACKARASVEVVEMLIKTYPTGLRVKDDDGKLPLHVACEWGADSAVVDIVLINYAEGIYVRDSHGKTAKTYAEDTKCNIGKQEVTDVLALSSAYCAVSRAALLRANTEYEAKAKGASAANATQIANLEQKHYAELNARYASESDLHRALDEMKAGAVNFSNEIQGLTAQMEKERVATKKDQDALVSTLEHEREKNALLVDEVKQLEIQHTKSIGAREELHLEVANANMAIQKMVQEMESLKGQLEVLREAEKSFLRRVVELEDQYQEAQDDLETMVKYSDELKEQKELLEFDLAKANRANGLHLKKIAEFKTLTTTLSNRFCSLTEEQNKFQSALDSQDAALKEVQKNRLAVAKQMKIQGTEMSLAADELAEMLLKSKTTDIEGSSVNGLDIDVSNTNNNDRAKRSPTPGRSSNRVDIDINNTNDKTKRSPTPERSPNRVQAFPPRGR